MLSNRHVLLTFCAVFAALSLASTAGAVSRSSSAEVSFLTAMNQARAAHGLAALRFDARLRRAARSHTVDMMRRQYFAHGAMGARLRQFGVGGFVGENLAWGVGSAGSPNGVVQRWLASPSHRANLLRPGFRRVGLGLRVGNFAGYSGVRVVTADFAGR
jgi:uncharacterized protein YkwD